MNENRKIEGVITNLRSANREHNESRALVRCPALIGSRDNPHGVVTIYSRAWQHHKPAHVGMHISLSRITEATRPGDQYRCWVAHSATPATPAIASSRFPAMQPAPQRRQSWLARLRELLGINITRPRPISYNHP